MRRVARASVTAACVVAIIMIGWGASRLAFRGINVEVTNHGPIMQDVKVRLTGISYSLGDLATGSSKAVRANPTGESSVSIEFTDSAGHRRSHEVDTYLEPGYCGTIAVLLTPQGTVQTIEIVRGPPCF